MRRSNIPIDPGMQAEIDQLNAEEAEAVALVPLARNRSLTRDPDIQSRISVALRSTDADSRCAVPVVRLSPVFGVAAATVHGRDGSQPARSRAAVIVYCNKCNNPTSRTVPFWVNAGSVIIQVDLCDECAAHAIDAGCEPQLGLPVSSA
ncbi:hypothetical protein [Microbacterium arborescens]